MHARLTMGDAIDRGHRPARHTKAGRAGTGATDGDHCTLSHWNHANLCVWGVSCSLTIEAFKLFLADLGLQDLLEGARISRDHRRHLVHIRWRPGRGRLQHEQHFQRVRRAMRAAMVSKRWRCVTAISGEYTASKIYALIETDSWDRREASKVRTHSAGSVPPPPNPAPARSSPLPAPAASNSARQVRHRHCRDLRLGTWNTRGLAGNAVKQLEVLGIVRQLSLDILAVQETWETQQHRVAKPLGFMWCGQPRLQQTNRRGEGGVGFFISDAISDRVTLQEGVQYPQSMWVRVRARTGRPASDIFVACIYMPVDGAPAAELQTAYEQLQQDVARFQQLGLVVLLGDFNARCGRASQPGSTQGEYGEETLNGSGTRLLTMLEAASLYLANGRRPCASPQWTRVQGAQKSIIDYIASTYATVAFMQATLHVSSIDITSDHFLVSASIPFTCRDRRRPAKKTTWQWRLQMLIEDGACPRSIPATSRQWAGILPGRTQGFC